MLFSYKLSVVYIYRGRLEDSSLYYREHIRFLLIPFTFLSTVH
jgi:hypothetical protein